MSKYEQKRKDVKFVLEKRKHYELKKKLKYESFISVPIVESKGTLINVETDKIFSILYN